MLAFQCAWSQRIEIQGNGIVIAGDGTNTPMLNDDTFFETTPISGSRIHTFKLTNKGSRRLNVESISSNSGQFIPKGRLRRLRANQTKTFEVSFEPSSIGDHNAIIVIKVKIGRARESYSFNISGNSSAASNETELMISQYYENGNKDQVEIKNLTDYDINREDYYLVKYNRRDNLNRGPNRRNVVAIDRIEPGATALNGQLDLKGDEIVIISTSKGRNCYADRIDIIGEQNLWGRAASFSKGGCASETAHTEFSVTDWIQLSLDQVDQALSPQNLYLGTYQTGPISWTNSGWTGNALPDRTRITFIEDVYEGNIRSIEACDLTINAKLNFDHDNINSVVVYGDLTINQPFIIGDTESLVMYDDDAQITGNIEKMEKSTDRNNTYDFTYWSSPIKDAKLSEVFQGVNLNRLYYYDQSRTTTSDKNHPEFWSTWVLASDKMENGKGYAAEGKSGETGIHDLKFTGVPNNGIIYQDVVFHDDNAVNSDPDNDFNMLGNPYPSAIDIEIFFNVNAAVIEPTVYLWTHATAIDGESGDYSFDDYASYNYMGGTGISDPGNGGIHPTKNIGSSQGFFVRAKSGGRVLFNNSMRMENANDQFFKGRIEKNKQNIVEKDRIWLNLATDQGGFNQILIGFDEQASDSYDSGYDALKFNGSNKIGFYSLLNQKKMTIQGLGSFNSSKELTLGFDTKLGEREYNISISKIEGKLKESELTLYDNYLQISHDLKKSAYIFSHDENGEYSDRFTLIFIHNAIEIDGIEAVVEELFVTNDEDVFSVVAESEVLTASVFDLRGRQIMQIHPNEKSFDFIDSESKKGEILLLQLEMKNQKQIVKKMYKQ